MSTSMANPFPAGDSDRHEIWNMLVRRDIEAFATNDWERHAADFLVDGFFGIDAGRSGNPDSWSAAFPDLETYRRDWSGFAAKSQGRLAPEALREAHFAATTLRDIDVRGDFAVAHKKFDGAVCYDDGERESFDWQTDRKSVV